MALKKGSGGLISRLLGSLRRQSGEEEQSPPSAPDPAAAEILVDDAFRLAIDDVCRNQDGRFQTRLQIISLVEFREAVGDRWWRVADKVMMIAEGVIGLHLGPGNSFVRQGQDYFLLLFRGCSQLEGRRRALAIAQDLGTRLVGDQFIGLERPLALAADLVLAAALHADGSLNHTAIHAAIGEMRAFLASDREAPTLRASLRPSRSGEADRGGLRRSLLPSQPPPERPDTPDSGKPVAPSALDRPQKGTPSDPGWEAIAHRKRRHHHAGEGPRDDTPGATHGPSTVTVAAPPLTPDSRLSLLWRPTWMGSAEAIAVYKAQIQRRDNEDEPAREGSRAYPAGGDGAETLDGVVIAGAVKQLAAAAGTDSGRSALVLPLHWASVTSSRRMALIQPLAAEVAAGRASRLVIELFGQPRDVGPRALGEVARVVRGLGREAILRVRFATPGAALAADCGFSAIGVDLTDLAPSERTDDEALLRHLIRLKDAAGRAGLACYVWGVRHRRVVVGTVHGGFAMINGPALMKDAERPGKVIRAPRSGFPQTP